MCVGECYCQVYAHSHARLTVYAKTYNLITIQKWCTITHACLYMCIMRIYAMILYMSIQQFVYHTLSTAEWNFLCFQKPISWSTYSGSVPRYYFALPPWYRHWWCFVFRSGMRVTSLPQIQSPSQPEKIEKGTSESSCHEKSSQDEELVVRI